MGFLTSLKTSLFCRDIAHVSPLDGPNHRQNSEEATFFPLLYRRLLSPEFLKSHLLFSHPPLDLNFISVPLFKLVSVKISLKLGVGYNSGNQFQHVGFFSPTYQTTLNTS